MRQVQKIAQERGGPQLDVFSHGEFEQELCRS
jgi:hypothetical protein